MEKSENKESLFSQAIREDIFVIVSSYLPLEDCTQKLSLLNKQTHRFMSGGVDFVWKQLFIQEFKLAEYKDHKRVGTESYRQFFKRSFLRYQQTRKILRGIIEETNKKTQKTFEGFLRAFDDRKLPEFSFLSQSHTFYTECLYKNLGQPNAENVNGDDSAEEAYNYHLHFQELNLPLYSIHFYEHNLKATLISPQSVEHLAKSFQNRTGLDAFPVIHTYNYKQYTVIDYKNIFGKGPNAVLSFNIADQSKVQYLAPNIQEFLQQHLNFLREGQYVNEKGEIEIFKRNPELDFGSTTITNGIRIDASAQFVHLFSQIGSSGSLGIPKYFFVYQIRISVDPETADRDFMPCQLLMRHWSIKSPNKEMPRTTTGPGVIGAYPAFISPTDKSFIYESCTDASDFESTMEGFFLFKYLKEGEIVSKEPLDQAIDEVPTFRALVKPFCLKLPRGSKLIDNPLCENQ